MIEYIMLAVAGAGLYLYFMDDPPPISGRYNQPGKFYYLKVSYDLIKVILHNHLFVSYLGSFSNKHSLNRRANYPLNRT